MIIRKKRIRSLGRNLKGIQNGQDIIVALPDASRHKNRLTQVGFSKSLTAGEALLPAVVGPVSNFNANGKYIIHKDKPKETAYRQQEWTWQEFRGRYDRVEQSKIVDVPYERYPRTFLEPPSVEISLATNPSGQLIAVSPGFTVSKRNEALIIHVINLFLELFGECHILDTSLNAVIQAPLKRLNWEILPHGKWPWKKLSPMVERVVSKQPDGNQKVINARLQSISDHNPEFVAVGHAGFEGYLVFGFPKKNMYILESTEVNNATYILENDWETLSGLTKAELLRASLHKDRVIHRESWFARMNSILHKM